MPLHLANAQRFMNIVANNAASGIEAGKSLAPASVQEAAKRRALMGAFSTLAGFSGEAAALFADAIRELKAMVQGERSGYSQLSRVNERLMQVIGALEEVSVVLHEQLIPNLLDVANSNEYFDGAAREEARAENIIFSPWFWQEGLDHLQMVLHDLREFHHDQMLLDLVRETEADLSPAFATTIPLRLVSAPNELCRYANDNSGAVH
jgi:hypothetical protein